MYTVCIHCQKPLGANDAIEALPIGRRVAFDGEKGRLWVVCRSCERWNLTPFDTRWEALEQCERAYRDTRVRLSTDNIGLARLRGGMDLVRIGRPLRPEFAAWRYGDQFGRRRRRNVMWAAGALVGTGLIGAGLATAGVALGAALPLLNVAGSLSMAARQKKILRGWMLLADGRRIAPTGSLRILELDVAEGWGLEAGVLVPQRSIESKEETRWAMLAQSYDAGVATVRGKHAMPLLRRFMPSVNSGGASATQVRDGVELIENAGGAERFGAWAASQRRVWGARQQQGDTGDLHHIPVAARLAFEMAVNEDAERRALEGELSQLETAWREAEALAGIADGLTPMSEIENRLAALRNPPS